MELAQRLVSTRKGAMTVSVIAAALAGIMILVYVNRYRHTVGAESAPVTVLVASQTIPKGTSGTVLGAKSLYTTMTIRQSQLVEGAFSDPSSLRDKVATRDIYRGAQLSAADFAPAATAVAASLTGKQRVVSIPVDSAHGLSGELAVGDHVDVYAGFNVVPVAPDGTPISGGQGRAVVRLLLSDITVVGIDDKGGAAGPANADVALRVTDAQAAKLAFASDNGTVWLALRPSTGAEASPPSLVTMETLLLGIPPRTVVRSFGGR